MQHQLEPREWREKYRKKNGYYPKVLFIGNVANNAYQIAKLLNNDNIECDVLCNDYYHIMGCPEWEDADIEREGIDQFYPQFVYKGSKEFIRPKWFAQGPIEDAIKYLISRRKNKLLGNLSWKRLEKTRVQVIEHKGDFGGETKTVIYPDWIVIIGYRFAKIIGSKRLKNHLDRVTNIAWHRYRDWFMSKIQGDWKSAFPDRGKLEWSDECDMWLNSGYKLQPLMKYYDVVVGFGGSVLLPYFAGYKNYVAFEHGTIRGFRHELNDSESLLMLAYAKSKVLYNTNTDCFEDAEYITRNSGSLHFCGLHGIGINELICRLNNTHDAKFRKQNNLSEDVFLILCPARHDFEEDHGRYFKGDEKMMKAISALANNGYDFVVVLIKWGRDYLKYKKEIDSDETLKNHVIWIDPLSKADFEDAICSCDIILDQFTYPVFGAIAIEAMLGKRAVLVNHSIDKEVMECFFGSTWPILEANDAEEIKECITRVLEDRDVQNEIATKQYEWVSKEHSAERISSIICGAMDLATQDGGKFELLYT